MKTIKGPAISLAQFAVDSAPFNSLAAITKWAAGHGYLGIQVPSFDSRLFDLAKAAESKKSALAMSCGSRPAKSTGTAQPPRPR